MLMIPSGGLGYDRVDSAYLDCLNDNLAVLLAHQGVTDIRTPLACQWYFDFVPRDQVPELVLTRIAVMDMIEQQTGCVLHRHHYERNDFLQQCAALIEEDRPVLCFGDAYFMPWLPYYQHEHMEHTFIIDGISNDHQEIHLVDAYYNLTEWGKALPTETTLPGKALVSIIEELTSPSARSFLTLRRQAEAPEIDLLALIHNNAVSIRQQVQERDAIRCFSRYYAERTNQVDEVRAFVLACWLIGRARALHGLWLTDVAAKDPHILSPELAQRFTADVVQPWQRLSEFTYVLYRRVSKGRAAPESCYQMLEQTIHPQEVQMAQALDFSLLMS
jgi:hypothetical protein